MSQKFQNNVLQNPDWHVHATERHGRLLVNTPAVYSGGPGLKFQAGDRL